MKGKNFYNYDFIKIKKDYGEQFAQLCRELFSTLLETEGLLYKILSENFAPSRYLYDAVKKNTFEFQDYINGFAKLKSFRKLNPEDVVSPEVLLDQAGYILFPECKTYDEIYAFRKYYQPKEELCTFNSDRLSTCRVWFAVKKDVDKIRRNDFISPQRQDEYGTSVISIQFTRHSPSSLSIKNRYNDIVSNPDATFSNDLDNIIVGLTESFIATYGIELNKVGKEELYLPGFIQGGDNKFYKILNCKGVRYNCENNVIVYNNDVIHVDPSRYLMMDDYLLDMSNKRIITFSYDGMDSFVDSIGKIKKVSVLNEERGVKKISITPEKGDIIEIKINRYSDIISYKNSNVTEIGNNFLYHSKYIQEVELPNVTSVMNNFLMFAKNLERLYMPKLEDCQDVQDRFTGAFLKEEELEYELQ